MTSHLPFGATYLWHHLKLLALADVLALANSRLKLLHDLVVQWLSGRDGHLDLSSRGADQLGELLSYTVEHAQSVVLGQSVEEVLQCVVLVLHACALLEFVHDLLLIVYRQRRRADHRLELRVFLEGLGQAVHCLCNCVEGGAFGGRGVLVILSVLSLLCAVHSTTLTRALA